MSCPINIWVSSTNWEQLKTSLDYNDMQFAIEMISNGYCCGVDTWLTFSISPIQNTCKWNFKTLILIFKITIKIFVKYPFHKMNIMCLLKIQGATKKKGWRPYKGKNIGQNCQTLNTNWIQCGSQHALIIKVEEFDDLTWNANFPIYQACNG